MFIEINTIDSDDNIKAKESIKSKKQSANKLNSQSGANQIKLNTIKMTAGGRKSDFVGNKSK